MRLAGLSSITITSRLNYMASIKPATDNIRRTFSTSRIGIIIALILVIGILSNGGVNHPINLLDKDDWSHFAGAKKTAQGIHIIANNRVITHRDTSSATPNPLVNVRGLHLKVSGDFQIDIGMSGVDNGATFQLYGEVPVIYDEWRQEKGSVRLVVMPSSISIKVWDGTSPSSVDERLFKVSIKNDIKVSVIHIKNNIAVKINNKLLGIMPDHNIFSKGTVWFGADANIGTNGWTLKSLQARGQGKGRVEIVQPPSGAEAHNQPDSLRNLASANTRHLRMGAAVSVYPLFTDEQYRKTAIQQFNMMTPENSMKPQFVHPAKNLYTFQDADSVVELALKNQISVHGHSLVMGKANPQWMQQTPKNMRQQVMTDHINTVVSHFKGRVAEWDVVNEPLSEDDIDYTNGKMGLRSHMWSDAMGETYIDVAFRAAHAADPAAKLYLNEFGLEKDGKRWDAMINLLQRLKARGVPIDGVGFEAHVYHEPDFINPEVLKRHIQILAELGYASRISEIDVLGDNPVTQASQYADVLKVCLSEPTCTSFTTWGVSDLYGSTTLSDRYPVKLGDSLLWGADYKPKPAFSRLQDILKQP